MSGSERRSVEGGVGTKDALCSVLVTYSKFGVGWFGGVREWGLGNRVEGGGLECEVSYA
jgi:hypothetical protein